MNILFPVFAVKRCDFNGSDCRRLETIRVDTDSVRVRSRYIKRFDSAMAAEIVLRYSGVEGIGSHVVLATDQTKILLPDDQMQETAHSANAAIAILSFDIRRRIHFKSYFATVAAAFVCRHFFAPLRSRVHTTI